MMDNFIIAQSFGFFALIVAIISIFQTNRLNFIIWMILQSLLLCCQYFFLNKFIAMTVCFVSILRLIVYGFKKKYTYKLDVCILILFTIMNLIVSIITFEIWYDIFPLVASTLVCYTIWQNKVVVMKWGLLISKVLWAIYATISHAYFSIILDVFIVIWTTIYLIKYNKKLNER